MTCKQVESYWEHWLAGDVTSELVRHLEACPRCRQQARELARASGWVRLLKQEPPQPGPAFWARLRHRLEESERAEEFWSELSWVAARAVLSLVALVFLLGLGLLFQSAAPRLTEFDSPPGYLDETTGVATTNGQLNRDQVVLTLVAYREPQP